MFMEQADSTRLTFLLRLRDGSDKLSWYEFHERYGQLLYRYARKRGASDADAEDIAQEVELYLFKALDGFEYDARKGRFRAYLRSSVIHAMGRKADRQARQPAGLDPHTFDHMASRKDTALDDQWEREWRLHRLRWAMRGVAEDIDPVTLKAFEMHVLGDRSVAETASELGLSKDSVYQAKSRTLKSLKKRLAEKDPEGDL